MSETSINKTLNLGDIVETLNYVKVFKNKTFVIKVGGVTAMQGTTVAEDIMLLKAIGVKIILVHGGGKQINETLKQYNLVSKFIDGIRVTDDQTIDLIEMVLSGKINKSIVRALNKQGVKDCLGLSGVDNSLLVAQAIDKEKYGRVGDVVSVNCDLLHQMISSGYLPVIAPFGIDKEAESLNINADTVASSIAYALKADKLLFLSDIDGILDGNNDTISKVAVKEIENLIATGIIHSGMIPKIQACIRAVLNGVSSVHIINGVKPHSLLRELFTVQGFGTIITKN